MKTIIVDGFEVDVVAVTGAGAMVCLTTTGGDCCHITWQDAIRLSRALRSAAEEVVPDGELQYKEELLMANRVD